jgi:hypothetical protein
MFEAEEGGPGYWNKRAVVGDELIGAVGGKTTRAVVVNLTAQ